MREWGVVNECKINTGSSIGNNPFWGGGVNHTQKMAEGKPTNLWIVCLYLEPSSAVTPGQVPSPDSSQPIQIQSFKERLSYVLASWVTSTPSNVCFL